MKKTLAILISALLAGPGLAMAGDDQTKHEKKKCTVEATVCIREMATALKKKGWVGIEWEDLDDGRPRISHVVQGSPAERAGVELGDVVVSFEGVPTNQKDEVVWAAMKRALVPGKVITLALLRGGEPREVEVELVPVPDHIIAQWVGMHVLQHHAAPAGDPETPSP